MKGDRALDSSQRRQQSRRRAAFYLNVHHQPATAIGLRVVGHCSSIRLGARLPEYVVALARRDMDSPPCNADRVTEFPHHVRRPEMVR